MNQKKNFGIFFFFIGSLLASSNLRIGKKNFIFKRFPTKQGPISKKKIKKKFMGKNYNL